MKPENKEILKPAFFFVMASLTITTVLCMSGEAIYERFLSTEKPVQKGELYCPREYDGISQRPSMFWYSPTVATTRNTDKRGPCYFITRNARLLEFTESTRQGELPIERPDDLRPLGIGCFVYCAMTAEQALDFIPTIKQ